MSERRRPYGDPEVLELFEEEPELLAIVDAIHATQAPRRSRPARPILIAAAAIAAIAVLVVIPWQFRGVDLTDRALAAIGDARVVHVVASRPERDQLLIDLGTGVESPTTLELESWFDVESAELRTTTRRNGVTVADTLTSTGAIPPDPVVATFVRGYRSALQAAELKVVRDGRLDGTEVVWVRASLPNTRRDEVALDVSTDLPHAFRLAVGSERPGPLWRVSAIDSRARRASDFTSREAATGPVAGAIESERTVTLQEAAQLLRGSGRWPGEQVSRLRLDRVVSQELTRTLADRTRENATGVELVYRDAAGAFVEVSQALTAEPAYGFAEGRLTLGFAPIPEGALALIVPERPDALWVGQLRAGDSYITIRGSQRALVVDAARSLMPLG
jgi:hypothetical protein